MSKRHTPPTTSFQTEIPSASADVPHSSRNRNYKHNHNQYYSPYNNHLHPTTSSFSSSCISKYTSRLFDPSQMDFQSALDQMKSLIFPLGGMIVGIQRVLGSREGGAGGGTSSSSTQWNKPFKLAYYRKQTKQYWARDDPAFVVIIILALALMSLVYTLALGSRSSSSSLGTMFLRCFLHGVLHFLLLGGILATLTRTVAHQPYMMMMTTTTTIMSSSSPLDGSITSSSSATTTTSSSIAANTNKVEWLYAFDIHCNAFVPFFMMVYVGQFLLLPIVLGKGFLSFWMSNLLYVSAFISYIYITHLGYRALPFLCNTEIFLFPIAIVIILFVLNVIGWMFYHGYNPSIAMVEYYFQ